MRRTEKELNTAAAQAVMSAAKRWEASTRSLLDVALNANHLELLTSRTPHAHVKGAGEGCGAHSDPTQATGAPWSMFRVVHRNA